jgi:hypothetical protein
VPAGRAPPMIGIKPRRTSHRRSHTAASVVNSGSRIAAHTCARVSAHTRRASSLARSPATRAHLRGPSAAPAARYRRGPAARLDDAASACQRGHGQARAARQHGAPGEPPAVSTSRPAAVVGSAFICAARMSTRQRTKRRPRRRGDDVRARAGGAARTSVSGSPSARRPPQPNPARGQPHGLLRAPGHTGSAPWPCAAGWAPSGTRPPT